MEENNQIPQPQINQVITSTPESKNIKYFIIILILVLIIISLGGYVALSSYKKPQVTQVPEINQPTQTISPTQELQPTSIPPTINKMANWKTLINEYGFKIKYPVSLNVFAEGINVDETNAPDILVSSNPSDSKDESPFLHINVAKKEQTVYKDMTLAEISKLNYDANLANKNTFNRVIIPYTSTTLDGKPAYTYTLESMGYSGKWIGFLVGGTISNIETITVVESENMGNYFIIVFSTDDPAINSVFSTFNFY